jgi:hypothetical protein
MAWEKLGSITLTGSQSDNQLTGLTSKKFNQIIGHVISGVGANQVEFQFGNGSIDTGTSYAFRKSNDGATDVTSASTSVFKLHHSSSQEDKFFVLHIINISAEEKIGIGHLIAGNTAGAGTAPKRAESVGKWANTSNQFDIIEHQSGNLQADTNLAILGTD